MAAEKGTELIHLTHDGNFKLDTDAKVLACRILDIDPDPNSNSNDDGNARRAIPVELQLDVTTMHPQGGGQPTDTGTITAIMKGAGDTDALPYSAIITKVTIDRATGIVTHAGAISVTNNCGSPDADFFPPDTRVRVSVNADNRALLSECHTAGHVVDAAMAKCGKLLAPTKGYHFMEGPYVEYKGAIDAKEREEFAGRLKVAFQDLVDENIPTNIQTLPVDEAEALCNRLAQNFNMKNFTSPDDPNPSVRVVTTAGGSSPCGGTHARSTGALKERGWCVKGLKCKKGVVRVRYGPMG